MAIFLVDRMNENINRGLTIEQAIIEAGTTRFKPVIISSITTIFGII
jgi:HAE1 family hydrophobic/amphiphilic exporter-1